MILDYHWSTPATSPMTCQSTRQRVLERLSAIEGDYDVRVLFAVESGSRAWGFYSPDSDYDVRFVYSRRPEYYLSIDVENHRDVIECPIDNDLDITGWDLRKALKLFHRSNPSIIEWTLSPFLYWEHGLLRTELTNQLPTTYSPTAGWFHYRSLAHSNFKNYITSADAGQVRLKKYLYVLRGLLAARWVERTWSPPPLAFAALVDSEVGCLDVPVNDIRGLLVRKRQQSELGLGERIPTLDAFIEAELQRPVPPDLPNAIDNAISRFNDLFRQILGEPWT